MARAQITTRETPKTAVVRSAGSCATPKRDSGPSGADLPDEERLVLRESVTCSGRIPVYVLMRL